MVFLKGLQLFQQKSGRIWKWPAKMDEQDNKWKDVICHINEPEKMSTTRNVYSVPELLQIYLNFTIIKKKIIILFSQFYYIPVLLLCIRHELIYYTIFFSLRKQVSTSETKLCQLLEFLILLGVNFWTNNFFRRKHS